MTTYSLSLIFSIHPFSIPVSGIGFYPWHDFNDNSGYRTIRMGNLYEIRKSMGMSQAAFAKVVGVSQATIARVELGKRTLPAYAWEKIQRLQARLNAESLDENADVVIAAQKLHVAHIKSLQKQILELENSLSLRKKELAEMRIAYNEAKCAMMVLLPERIIFKDMANYQQRIQKDYEKAVERFTANSPECQQMLVMQIDIAVHSILIIKEQLNAIQF